MDPRSIDGAEKSGELRLVTLLAAAGDATRLSILSLLRTRAHSVGEICEALQMAQPRVSHHLAILRRGGLLEVAVEGRQRFYRWSGPGRGTPEQELGAFLDRWLADPDGHGIPEVEPEPRARPGELEDFLL